MAEMENTSMVLPAMKLEEDEKFLKSKPRQPDIPSATSLVIGAMNSDSALKELPSGKVDLPPYLDKVDQAFKYQKKAEALNVTRQELGPAKPFIDTRYTFKNRDSGFVGLVTGEFAGEELEHVKRTINGNIIPTKKKKKSTTKPMSKR
eukprot:m.12640 g.12640  ORF g.12640 m.12640 type:complete len:148 (+) comp9388_c0_seq1:205-648(+)